MNVTGQHLLNGLSTKDKRVVLILDITSHIIGKTRMQNNSPRKIVLCQTTTLTLSTEIKKVIFNTNPLNQPTFRTSFIIGNHCFLPVSMPQQRTPSELPMMVNCGSLCQSNSNFRVTRLHCFPSRLSVCLPVHLLPLSVCLSVCLEGCTPAA